jgi:TPR repeat protein
MRYALAATLLLLAAAPAGAQALPPPERSSTVWDTQALVNEAHNLVPEALPDLRQRAEAGDARSQAILGLVYEMGAADQKPQPPEALKWFAKAADQGVAWAEVWAADF